ncbi:hypothetical protein GJ496_011030 [Pomphorhynchus laevis]|nr:hypothetical protein GJ496_011030 [Pomphorhynchus laevis]
MMPTILVMKEGSESSEGRAHMVSNMNACIAVGEAVRTTLGPRGMDKLIVDSKGKATISNDGATVMNLLEVAHPAARALVEIAQSQDSEVGDGTTTVVLLACEILNNMKKLVEDGVHPSILVRAVRKACNLAVEKVKSLAILINPLNETRKDSSEWRQLLERCASTSLNSKLIASHKAHFAKLVVDAVLILGMDEQPLKMIGIKKITGGSVNDSWLVPGIAFKKAFSYAGFEMQRKKYVNWPKIALLNIELELKAERDNAEIRLTSVKDYQQVIDAEWNILYEKLAILHKADIKIVLSRLPIGDVATQYFADRDMFCAGRIPEDDLNRTMMACGGSIITTLDGVPDSVFATCEVFEERQIGNERFNLFTGCPKAKACTFILRGGAEEFMEETERSLHDAIMIVKRTVKNDSIVAGGGAVDMELARYLRDYSRTVPGKEQIIIRSFARSFESIPRQLCDNAGFDSVNILNKLRQMHAERYCLLDISFSVIPKGAVNVHLELCQWDRTFAQKHENLTEGVVMKMKYFIDREISSGVHEIRVTFNDTQGKAVSYKFPIELSYVEKSSPAIINLSKDDECSIKISQTIQSESQWYGVDINREDIADNFEAAVWEPALVKINTIIAATEAVCLVLNVDQTIKAPSSAERAA